MTEKIYETTVIGGGSAGIMAALRSVLNNDETLFFPGNQKNKKKSRAMWVRKVENIPGFLDFKQGINNPNKQAYDFLSNERFEKVFYPQLNTGVQSIEKDELGIFTLVDSNGQTWKTKYVILTTGMMDVQPFIEGDIRSIFPFANSQAIEYCVRCDGHHTHQNEIAVIGHTSSAAWVAIMINERYDIPNLTILTNGKSADFDEETSELIELYNINVVESEIVDFLGDKKEGKLEGFILESGDIIHAQNAFVSLGVIVYNELAKELGAKLDNRGFVVTDEKGQSSVENFYIAGDLRAGIKKQIYTAWDSAVDSADDINAKIRRERRQKQLLEFRTKKGDN
ncbi:putative thioredoxin [Halobacteriovorax marinus SJ]|uniref:Thioredoxin n=1 Tax=Halobacteriovorax marinus (strain ATCC BAA-682 / DSM 15412 / SJ) TaxID=862908 RepID=E1X5D3_HALMS|nr:NAD(P)/FAD-dependent oxidoreductase [Halobacteriovorax marinus]CBW27254.1 putative thioredoxin [Halobacteriovorax marinus SJ]